MRIHSLALAAAGALSLVAMASSADAATYTFNPVSVVSGQTVTIAGTPSGTLVANTGMFKLTGISGSPDFDAFCVDLSRTISGPGVPPWLYDPSLTLGPDAWSISFTTAQLDDVRKLAKHAFTNTLNAVERAAMQVAIWKVLYPGFTYTSGVSGLIAQANTYHTTLLPTLTDTSGIVFLDSRNDPKTQGLVVMVPEPATWAMLITGFGLVGLGLRRRRHAQLGHVAS